MEASREERLSRRLSALALLSGPGLIFLARVLAPAIDLEDRAEVLDFVAENTARWNTANALFWVGFLLMIPALIAAARYFRRQRPGLSLVATALAPLAPILNSGTALFRFMDEAFAHPAADRAEMLALHDRGEAVTMLPIFFGLLMLGLLGMLVLVIGLWRSKVMPVWVPVLIVVGFVIGGVAPQDNAVFPPLADAVLWTGFGAIGLRMLSEARRRQPLGEPTST